MTAGASAREARADADEQSGCDQRGIIGLDRNGWECGDAGVGQGCQQEPGHEREPPGEVAGPRDKHPADNSADACDPAVDEHEQRGRDANDDSTDCGRPRCECAPVDGHGGSLGPHGVRVLIMGSPQGMAKCRANHIA
jgi:hypothetical protein